MSKIANSVQENMTLEPLGGPGYPTDPLSILMRLAKYIHVSGFLAQELVWEQETEKDRK